MTQEELQEHKARWRSCVYLKGELEKENQRVRQLSRWDKNGSHKEAILKAIEWRNEAKKTLNEKLLGHDYSYTMLAMRKATRLSKKKDKSEFLLYNPFKQKDESLNPEFANLSANKLHI